MRLVRLMVFLAAKHDFGFSASHILSRLNSGADAISRNKLNAFFKEVLFILSCTLRMLPIINRCHCNL